MDRRTRICVWIILIGLGNFLAYVIVYTIIYGEAVNGTIWIEPDGRHTYALQSGREFSSRWVFLLSGVHSISIWPTVAAIMLAMLTLAKDRITSMSHSTVERGRTLMTTLAVLIAICTAVLTALFTRQFLHTLDHPRPRPAATRPADAPAPPPGKAHPT